MAAELELVFHRSLYLREGVAAAVEAYQGYAETIDVEQGEVDTKVTLRGFDERYGEMIGDSFANHALFETVVRSRETLGGVTL